MAYFKAREVGFLYFDMHIFQHQSITLSTYFMSSSSRALRGEIVECLGCFIYFDACAAVRRCGTPGYEKGFAKLVHSSATLHVLSVCPFTALRDKAHYIHA